MNKKPPRGSQLELPIHRPLAADRNLHKGGRSFYFFDFDDNVMRLPTPIFIFENGSSRELAVSTGAFTAIGPQIGEPGPYENYHLDLDDSSGSFRRFRDRSTSNSEAQPFVEDLRCALRQPEFAWKGPSWELFFHAVFNGRPISIITARGHSRATLEYGTAVLHNEGYLPRAPNFLSVYPVGNAHVRQQLAGDRQRRSIPELKKAAIIASVETAMTTYGENPHHRFGMSDDAPDNLALAIDAMRELKARYPANAFFAIDSSSEILLKTEILADGTDSQEIPRAEQLALFAHDPAAAHDDST